jgi:ABC-type transport system substrate-binding protein
LDPALATTPDELLIAGQLFRSLTAYDPVTLAPKASLATSWRASADQRHWDFTLDPNARFSDGRAVIAADVLASLQRVEADRAASPGAALLQDVTAVTSPRAGVVHFDLATPLAVLPSVLGSPNLSVLPAGTGADPEQLVGSGPFRIRSSGASELVLERAPGEQVPLDGVEFVFYPDVGASYQAFVTGQLDWSRVPADQLAAALARYGKAGVQPYMAELFYGFNLKSPTFADRRFREAILRAVNRGSIVNGVYHGSVLPLGNVVVPGIPGYPAPACGEPCGYDPVAARALVAAAFPGRAPPAVMIDYDDDPTQELVAKAIAADLTAVGIRATLRGKPLAAYQAFAASGQLQLFHLGWVAGYPSPEAFLGPLFGSGATANLTHLGSSTVDAALASARQEPDLNKGMSDYAAAESAVLDQIPLIPIGQYQTAAVVSGRTRGVATLITGMVDFSRAWVAH